jgi:plastocyanin
VKPGFSQPTGGIVTRTSGFFAAQILTVSALAALAACNGGDSSGGVIGPGNPGGGSPGPSGATITISSGRITPAEVTISVGQSVTFVNNDGRTRNISSDPHPAHTDCTQVNAVGNLGNGQTRLTNSFPSARTCGFHDHDDPDNANIKGRIIIQ